MKFEEFVEKAKEYMEQQLGKDVKLEIQTVRKNNGTVYTGICTVYKIGKRISPILYLEPYYEIYQEQGEIEGAMEDIFESMVEKFKKAEENAAGFCPKETLAEFDNWKDKIVYYFIQAEGNEEFLKNCPHILYLDLAVLFYLYLPSSAETVSRAIIRNEHVRIWNVTTEELYQLASKNTPTLLPVSFCSIAELLRRFCNDDKDMNDEKMPLYVLSNRKGVYGAAAVLYDGVLKKLAERFQADLILIPSSVHEFLVIPETEEKDMIKLQECVKIINETEVAREEVLSNHIYRYSRENDLVEIAA